MVDRTVYMLETVEAKDAKAGVFGNARVPTGDRPQTFDRNTSGM